MTISVQDLLTGIEKKNGFPLDQPQKAAICHGAGPLLIAAGPGTGKTEVLVARCLKLICCDDVPPGSVILTTFTEKAARNLEDRLAEALISLSQRYPNHVDVDPSELRVGTLHGLCNRILQEFRYIAYQNLRLLDEMETAVLIHRLVEKKVSAAAKADIEAHFGFLFGKNPPPYKARWDWTLALITLFNRVIEDEIDLSSLRSAGGVYASVEDAFRVYEGELAAAQSCDFSHLLRHFLDFLGTGQGNAFLEGSGELRAGLAYVLVDEYQDTNPIQESIYFRLADAAPHNITVVGDDDQALYRFRGGTVECMVGFPSVCHARWTVTPRTIYLSDNHRSDKRIVKWCNEYIGSFAVMQKPKVRTASKPQLTAALGAGAHPAVGLIRNNSVKNCAADVASLAKGLLSNGAIQDYSQCVLLLRSTQNSRNFAGPYQTALKAQQIPVYNPRSRDYLDQPEVAQCLGAFVRIVDPNLSQLGRIRGRSSAIASEWVDQYDVVAKSFPKLATYVADAQNAIAARPAGDLVTPDTPTVVYRILAHEPFVTYQSDAEMDLRLSKLTRLFEAFCAQYGRDMRIDPTHAGRLPGWWYGNLYYGLCGYMAHKKVNDDEDDDVTCPPGFFPIMTVHQAKGLEFDFVFVGNLGARVSDSTAHHLEEELRPFRENAPSVVHTIKDAQWHDDIRQHYVAYSRARYALILTASDSQLRKTAAQTASFGGQGGGWVNQTIFRL